MRVSTLVCGIELMTPIAYTLVLMSVGLNDDVINMVIFGGLFGTLFSLTIAVIFQVIFHRDRNRFLLGWLPYVGALFIIIMDSEQYVACIGVIMGLIYKFVEHRYQDSDVTPEVVATIIECASMASFIIVCYAIMGNTMSFFIAIVIATVLLVALLTYRVSNNPVCGWLSLVMTAAFWVVTSVAYDAGWICGSFIFCYLGCQLVYEWCVMRNIRFAV
ncbi:MAG: hypothetical protein WC525_09990 [Candidatus Thermoplasmatota archaeon]